MTPSDTLRLASYVPAPGLLGSYVWRSLVLWGLLKIVQMLAPAALRAVLQELNLDMRTSSPTAIVGMALLVAVLVWFDHFRSRENYFHATLGCRLSVPILVSAALIVVLELVI